MIFIKLATRDAHQFTRVKYPTCWKHLLADTSGRKLPHVTQNFATIECVACPNGVVLHRVDGALYLKTNIKCRCSIWKNKCTNLVNLGLVTYYLNWQFMVLVTTFLFFVLLF